MQSQVTGNHACPPQMTWLYFPGVARDTWETKKAIKPSSKNLSFNSALLTLRIIERFSLCIHTITSPRMA